MLNHGIIYFIAEWRENETRFAVELKSLDAL